MSQHAQAHPRRLSEEIASILKIMSDHPMRLRDLIRIMQGRAYNMLLILLSLPFCLPIPLPGLSTVFGTIIALIGLRLALLQQPVLPKRMLDTELSAKMMTRVLTTAHRLALSFEYLLRPRLSFMVEWPILHRLNGLMICLSGVFLLLPLPIPLSNLLPALTIILVAAAMLERDGYFVILGIIAFIANLIFFGAIFIGGAAAVVAIKDFFQGVPPGD